MPDLLRGRYEPLEVVGQGGEGRVLKALDRQHDRIVALKVRTVGDGADRDAMLTEARILLAIPPHSNLPLVREDFFDGDQYVIAMDWIEGTDLAKLVRARGSPGLAPSSVFRWLADAASALTHLHTLERPVVHGDLKPANLILTSGGRVVLVDFGLSSAPDSARRRGGTVGYAAPELAAGGAPSRASDVYSLAATAFELLVGEPPTGIRPTWDGFDPHEAEVLEAAVRSGLATDPARRPATPGAFVERLRAGWGATLPTGVLTFCLTDIDGSTALWETEPAAMARALVRHDELAADVVEHHGGRFLKSMGEGDATVSVFPAAGAAIDAMIELQQRLSDEREGRGDLRLRVRVAVHTGEAEQRDGDYFGPTLNLAARLRGLADGGEVYLSSATAVLVRDHLPPGASLVELGAHRLRGLRDPETVFALDAPGVAAPPPGTVCPYPGLPAFEAGDADRFFGRDAVVSDLVGRLHRHPFVALVGASGSGKSSVLRAGVGPAWGHATVVSPGPAPAPLREGPDLVIVDQLEEAFTLCTDVARRTQFLDSIAARRGPVALGVRADFYGRCAEHPALATAVAGHHVLLGPMSEAALRRAITGPAEVAGLKVEPALVDVLVGEVGGEPGALPLLSHALRATWQHRDGRTLTLEAYRATGGLRAAIATTAEEVFGSLDPAAQDLARRTFVALTEPGEGTEDSRRRATLAELTPASGDQGLASLLQGMASARLVTVGDDAIEVAHEALIREWPRLRAWLDEDRDGLRLHRHLSAAATAWDALGREPAELYRGQRLATASEWAERTDDMSTLEAEFLGASGAEQTRGERARLRTTRRLRGLLAGVAVALVIAVIAATVAVGQQRRASSARDRADVARMAAVSRNVVSRQPDLGLLLAVVANDLEDTDDTRGTLLNALETHPLLDGLVYGVDSQLEAAVLSPDGALLATPTSDGTGTILWDTTTRRRRATLTYKDDFSLSAAISPDGRWLAVPAIYDKGNLPAGRLEVWDLRTRRLHKVVDSPAGAMTTAAFSADGKRLFTQGGQDSDTEPPDVVVIWDTTTWEPEGDPWVLAPRYSDDKALAVSPDGALVAMRLPDDPKSVGVWRVADRSPVGPPIALAGLATRDLGPVEKLAFDPDGTTLVITTNLGPIFFVDPITGTPRRPTLDLPESSASALEYSRDGSMLAIGRLDGRTQLYDVATGEPLGPPLAASAANIVDVSFSSDGSRLVTTGRDRVGALWRLDGRRAIGVALSGQEAPVTEARFTPDGAQLVTAAVDGTVVIRDASGRAERSVTLPGEVLSVDVSRSGRVAAGGNGGGAALFDLDGTNRVDVALGPAWAQQVAFSPDGDAVAIALDTTGGGPGGVGPGSGVVRFVDARSGRDAQPAIDLDEPLWGVAFAPDGRTIAVVAANNVVHFFDLATRRRLDPPIENVDSPFTSIAYSPDGKRVALGIESGVVRTYDASTHLVVGAALEADDAGVFGVAYSPDGRLVAGTSLGLSTTRLWATDGGAPLGDRLTGGRVPYTFRTYLSEHFTAARPAFSPDGRHLVTPGYPGATVVWDLDPRHWRAAACAVVGRDLSAAEWRRYLPGRSPHPVCTP